MDSRVLATQMAIWIDAIKTEWQTTTIEFCTEETKQK